MSEYSDWLEKWATTEGMGIEPEDAPADEQEWSEDDFAYWCRSEKRTAVDWLRDQDVLP